MRQCEQITGRLRTVHDLVDIGCGGSFFAAYLLLQCKFNILNTKYAPSSVSELKAARMRAFQRGAPFSAAFLPFRLFVLLLRFMIRLIGWSRECDVT